MRQVPLRHNYAVDSRRSETRGARKSEPARNHATCTVAQCESEEINSGEALWMNSLRLQYLHGGNVKLTWRPPYAQPDTLMPQQYRVFRRAHGDDVFVQIADTSNLEFVDSTALNGNYQYEVRAVW